MDDFNREVFFLGSLCKRGHDWQGTGRSLRYQTDGGCVRCQKERTKKFYDLKSRDPEWIEHKKKLSALEDS